MILACFNIVFQPTMLQLC